MGSEMCIRDSAETITLSDADDIEMSSATATISSGFTAGDVLGFTDQDGISGSFDGSTGVLNLSGTATVAQYQAALRSVTYHSTSDDPTATSATRTITWKATDADADGLGAQTSTVVAGTINLTAVNDAPTDIALDATSVTENQVAVHIANISGTDPEGDDLTYTIVGGDDSSMFEIVNSMDSDQGSDGDQGIKGGFFAGDKDANYNTLHGLRGDDVFAALHSDHHGYEQWVYGEEGSDTAVFSRDIGDYTISKTVSSYIDGGGADGVWYTADDVYTTTTGIDVKLTDDTEYRYEYGKLYDIEALQLSLIHI